MEESASPEAGKAAPAFATPVGPWVFLAVATLSQTGMSLTQQGIAVLAVFIREALGLSFSQMGALVSATSLGVVVGFVAAGTLVDRFGPRWLLAWGTTWTTLWALVLGTARTYPVLLGLLFLLGVGLATVPSAGTRAVFEVFAGPVRGMVMGIRQSGVPIGSALAASLLPLAVGRWGEPRVLSLLAAVLALTGFGFAALIPRWPAHARSAPRPWREILPALGPMAVAALLVAGQYAALTFTIVDLHGWFGWPVGLAGLGLAVVQIGGGVGRVGLGWWSDRLGGRRPPAIAVTAVVGAAMALALAWLPRTTGAVVLVPLLFLLGFGTVGWNGLALTWAGERVPARRAGQAMSWAGSAAFLGSALYPPLFGWVVDRTGSFHWAWTGLAGVLVLALGVVFWVARRPVLPREAGA
jgi:MFS family permease